MNYNIDKQKWKLYRIREDREQDVKTGKYFGNNYRIAEITWRNYQNPLTLELLIDPAKNISYFQEHDTELYKPQRSYNSYVKSRLFDNIKNSDWIIDIGCGKGQDLFRYAKYGIKNVLFIDSDKDALVELTNRKFIFAKNKEENKMGIYIKEMDLNNNYKKNIEHIRSSGIPLPTDGVPIIVCNFALHYLVSNAASINNITQFIGNLLKSGGKFIFTAFNGKVVFDLLQENNGRFSIWENNVLKYDIKKKYTSKTFTGTSQLIDVLLPFSSGEYYTESLVNNNLLEKYFKKKKMNIELHDSFEKYYEDFKKDNRKVYDQLTENDKEYIKLYYFSSYYKK